MLRRILAATLLVLAFTLGVAPAAQGAGCAPGTTPSVGAGLGAICVPAKDPGESGTGSVNEARSATPSAAGTAGCFKTGGAPVPCSSSWGVWSGANQCYAAPHSAPAGSPAWQGHTTGSLSLCTACSMTGGANTCNAQVLWSAPGQAVALPDPGQLAQEALGVLRLETAQVRTAPQSPAHSYVGVVNWMWVPRAQWATLTKTVTAGGTQVTVTARPSRVVWDMGPGTHTCYGPGEQWQSGMTDAARTSCSYTYETTSVAEPGHRFGLSAAIGYDVTWVCTGSCTQGAGSLGLVDAPAGTGELTVLQRQTVVVG